MFRSLAVALGLVVLLAACDSGGTPQGGISPGDTDNIRLRHVDAVNAARAQAGAGPVRMSAELNAAAETHARDMANQQRAWHFGSDLTSPRERAARAGYRGEIVGENLSEGSDSDLVVLRSWLDFGDTRAVVVDPSAQGIGLGWYQEPAGKIWWVQLIGT